MTRSTLTATQKTDSIDYQAEATTADFKNARLYSIELTPPACKLDLEENWTNVDCSQKYEELCIKTGEMGEEKLRVDVWAGAWVNLITDLTGSAWNNISVSDYLNSDTFTIRFTGSNESSDTIRDTWQIDAVLLHTWNDTDNVSSRNWSIWSNANNPDTDPWIAISWNYNFPNETGYYQFYSIATDNATNIESAPGSADASCYYNPSPTQANEGPPNSSIKINITPPLNVTVDDDETLTAYWLSNSSGMWKLFGTNNSIDTSSGAVNIIQTNINFSSWGTTYWWSVNVTDGTSWSNVTYHFTTNFLSNITNPSPANESSNQNIKPICNITVSDEDGGTVDVFFYENTTGVWKLQQTNNSVDVTTPVNVIWNNYSNATLYSTTYWWKVNVTDDKGVSIEEIYHFTTSYPPTLSNPYPENGSNSVPISPVCTITISDNDGGTVTVKIFENTTGVWKLQQTNNSVDVTTPATVIWNNYSNASEFNTPYWWKVNVTDGTGRSSEGIYHFTTAQGNPPIQSAENPTDASTNIPITITTINVTIEDLDGDSLDWTIETNPDIGSSSGFNEGNGSKICTVSGLTYGTTYTWYVNATDGIDWSNETYTFTTSYRPELSNPGPSNGSSEQNLTPACNITVSDIDGGTVNVSFYENTTGIWKLQQTNTSIDVTAPANVVWTIYTNATQRNTTYWWKINVTDNDGNSREEIYHFTTTKGNPPQIALVNPSPNGTANVAILPSCQIWANDTDGDTLTVYWYENSTGSYQLRATYNNNVSANSITGYIFSEFSDYSKTYYWKVVVNESYYNTTATYYFTTEVNNPPEISNPSPTNGSTNIAPIPWTNITITDTEEDIMTITWYSNSSGSWVQYGSNTSCSNGTYRQLNSNFSDYSKTYWWNVTVNDGKETNKSWYYFTTGVIQTSVDTISPYEQTTSPLTVNATGGSVLDNVTLYYRYTTDNITVFQPSYKNAGTGSAGIGSSLTPGYPSGLAGNDFMILQLMVLGNSGAPNTPAGWELKFGPDATGSNDGYCWVYYTYATGDESGSLTVDGLPGTGGKFARIYSFENVSLTDPFDSSTGWETSTGSTISDVDVTTSIDKEYAVNLVNVGEDANTYVDFAGETGGDWIELVAQYSNAAGNDGTLQIQGATMPTAGTIYGGTFSMGASDPAGVRGFALMPRTVEWTVWSDGSNPDTASPWSWEFDFPNSTGYYEFYSIGKKTGSADELAPQTADTKCNYTQIGTLPAVITNVSTGVEETNATLWGYLQNNGSADTTCGFWWDTDSGSPYANNQSVGTIANTSTFNYNASSLTPGQLYYYKAWANNSAGYNTTANELIFLTKPNAPNNLHAQTNNSQTIYITWTKGNGANNTYIEYNTTTSIWLRGQGIMIYNDTGTNYEHTGLDSGTKYYYQAWSYTTWDALHKWSDMNESGNNITWYAPSVTNESPINQSIGITLNPTLSIQVNHSNEFIMNITWYWGEDESCPNFIGINSSVNNGTYFMMNDNNFSAKSKTYYWRVTVNDGNGGWTNITFHFKTTGVNKEIISKEKTAYSLEISPDSTILYGFINNTNVTTPIDRNWHYVVLTYEGTTIKLYEDGKLKNSTILIGSIPTNNNDLMFGDRLTGTLDELRVSAVARSQEWINTTYKMTSSPESFITVEKEQNQQYTYLKIKIKNTGSTTIKTQDSTILINGTDRSFIQIQPYLYPLKNTSIFINVSVAGSKRNKFITGNGITKYEGYG